MAGPGGTTRGRSAIVVVVGSPIAPADLSTLCSGVRARVERSTAEVVVIDLGGVDADAVTVDAMARLALVARRLGRAVELRDPPPALLELLAFTGLDAVVAGSGDELRVELQGEPEEREDPLDVEEEAELDDPAG